MTSLTNVPLGSLYNNLPGFQGLPYSAASAIVKPENLLDHMRYLILARDYTFDVETSGSVKFKVDTPEFRENGGLIAFLNSSDSSYKHNIGMINKFTKSMSDKKRNKAINFDIPFGIVDVSNPENKGLLGYYKITSVPTIVFQSYDGNFHQFNGVNGLVAAIKHYFSAYGAEYNILDFGDYRFADPSPLNGALVNVNLSEE
jgi:hypothetical protein